MRVGCVVPYCRRTTVAGRPDAEWLCPKHWPTISKRRRQVWGRLRKQWRRYGPEKVSPARWFRIWDRLKREAIERAGGIG